MSNRMSTAVTWFAVIATEALLIIGTTALAAWAGSLA